MIRRGLLSLLYLATTVALAQTPPVGVCKADVAETISNGLIGVVPFASIKVCGPGNTAASCLTDNSVANLYTTPALSVTSVNPQITDAGGNWYFCLPVGHYGIEVVAGVGNFFIPDTTLSDDWSKGGYVTGDLHVSGHLYGNLVGNVAGVVTGSVIGNASTATAAAAIGTACNPVTQFAYGVDASWNAICHSLPALGAQYYQTASINGVTQTQRPTLNFTSRFALSDASSPPATTVDLGSTGVAAGTYIYPTAQVDAFGRVVAVSSNTVALTEKPGNTCGVIYQNTSGSAIFVVITHTVAGGSGATLTAVIGSMSPPTNTADVASAVAAFSGGATNSVKFIVPNTWYYEVTRDITCGIGNWAEWNLP